MREALATHEAAGDARRLGERARRNQEAQAIVARAPPRAAARVDHEAHQEPAASAYAVYIVQYTE